MAERGEIHPVRLIVCRTPLSDAQAVNRGQDPDRPALFPVYDYHPMITDRTGDVVEPRPATAMPRPSSPTATSNTTWASTISDQELRRNAAWLILNSIAHNLTRWATRLGLGVGPTTTKIRRPIYNVTETPPDSSAPDDASSCASHGDAPGPD